MAINLQKGQKISLGLSKIKVGLGWEPNAGTGQDFDLDAFANCQFGQNSFSKWSESGSF